eukprot:8379036-Ditylum_brightwellii.AAC.1
MLSSKALCTYHKQDTTYSASPNGWRKDGHWEAALKPSGSQKESRKIMFDIKIKTPKGAIFAIYLLRLESQ